MTKTQIWLAAFLVLFIFLFLLSRITKDDDTGTGTEVTNPVPQTGMSSGGDSDGVELIRRNGCVSCHGPDLEGTPMAPPLQNLAQYWNRDNLVNYLRNPSSFMDSDRFKAYKEKYPGTIMPPFNNVDVKDLGKIADYLLTK
ncbi:MAG: cytochrome c [Ignavibacteriaceae bacterium]